MIVYRLSKTKYAHDLSGHGAERNGGRWNSPGYAMVYASQSRALCTAEIAVHTPMGNLPEAYSLVTIDIPGHSILHLASSSLPKDWKAIPPGKKTQILGDHFIRGNKFLCMKVPSVVVPGEFNFLLNPSHPKMKRVTIMAVESFEFDMPLFIR